jgi:hypothetical protein
MSLNTTTPTGSTQLVIDPITTDNVINHDEAGAAITVSGKATGTFQAGDVVNLIINFKAYKANVGADGAFSVSVAGSEFVNASIPVVYANVAAHDAAGNVATATARLPYTVDTVGPNGSGTSLVLDPVTADNVINDKEAGGSVAITGRVGGEYKPGDLVTVVVNLASYTGTTAADGSFSISVKGSDLAADADKTLDVSVAAHDAAGNLGQIATTKVYGVDRIAPDNSSTQVTIDPVTADNVVNANEAAGSVPITGHVKGDFSAGDTVTLVVTNGNGKIDSRAELFGGNKGDGFAKLATYDTNHDGVVDAKDADFSKLLVWQDANSNHQTDAGELRTLAQAGIASLNVAYLDQWVAQNGNYLGESSSATRTDGSSVSMIDAYFTYAPANVPAAAPAASPAASLTAAQLLTPSNTLLDHAFAGPLSQPTVHTATAPEADGDLARSLAQTMQVHATQLAA